MGPDIACLPMNPRFGGGTVSAGLSVSEAETMGHPMNGCWLRPVAEAKVHVQHISAAAGEDVFGISGGLSPTILPDGAHAIGAKVEAGEGVLALNIGRGGLEDVAMGIEKLNRETSQTGFAAILASALVGVVENSAGNGDVEEEDIVLNIGECGVAADDVGEMRAIQGVELRP